MAVAATTNTASGDQGLGAHDAFYAALEAAARSEQDDSIGDGDGAPASPPPHAANVAALFGACARAISAEHIFSANEELRDVATCNLPLLLTDALAADAILRIRASDPALRLALLERAEAHYRAFLDLCDSYALYSDTEKRARETLGSATTSAADRRSMKIERHRRAAARQAEINSLADAILHFRRTRASASYSVPTLFIHHPSPQPIEHKSIDAEDGDADNDDMVRQYCRLRIAHCIAKVVDDAAILSMEKSMLQSRPEPRHQVDSDKKDVKLDGPHGSATFKNATGPLLDRSGRPLRPFTIVADRRQIAQGVFRPGHSMPTMTIDEYLEEEMRCGGIIPSQKQQLEPQRQSTSTVYSDSDSEDKVDKATYKARDWDRFTDENPKGWGNRGGNRG